jgi:hypothetical protein
MQQQQQLSWVNLIYIILPQSWFMYTYIKKISLEILDVLLFLNKYYGLLNQKTHQV